MLFFSIPCRLLRSDFDIDSRGALFQRRALNRGGAAEVGGLWLRPPLKISITGKAKKPKSK